MRGLRLGLLSATALACACSAAPIFAQNGSRQDQPEASEAADQSLDIVVTARKRSERISDVPMTITAASGEQLAMRGINDVADLAKVTTALTATTTYSSTPVYTIRGIGFYDNSLAISPAVSVYTDQIPLPFSIMTEGAPLDVARVEVLKGPQGTLFGQNSTGGAINYVANKPTDHFSAGGKIGYGRFNAINANAYVSGPLSDTLGVRVSGALDRRSPWQQSLSRPGDELGRRRFATGRLLLDWKPTDALQFELSVNGWIDRSDTQAAQFLDVRPTVPVPPGYAPPLAALGGLTSAPDKARRADWTPGRDYGRHDDFHQFALRGEWDVNDAVKLTSITSYSELKRRARTDPDGAAYPNSDISQIGKIKSFFQELRLEGPSADGPLKWMVGVNYAKDRSRDYTAANNIGTNSLIAGVFFIDGAGMVNNQNVETKAAFGSLDYKITSTLTAQGSIRYTDSRNRHAGCGTDLGNGLLAAVFSGLTGVAIQPGQCVMLVPGPSGAPVPSLTPVKVSLDEDNVSWKAGLSWKPTNATLLYASVTRGYKSGVFSTLPALSLAQLVPVKQESILAYEVGLKQQLLDNRADITLAAFHYDYDDKQLLGYIAVPPFGNLPGIVSIPKSRVNGIEGSLTWRPATGLTLSGGAAYIASKVTRSAIKYDADSNLVDVKGEAFPFTPKYQLTGDAQYEFPVSQELSAFVGANARYQSSSAASFGGNPAYRLPGYTLLDLRAGIFPGDNRWRFEVWAHNVTDKFYATNIIHVVDTRVRHVGMPATYGASISFKI
jgi:outer membrane receptor protein involved in Fe transport